MEDAGLRKQFRQPLEAAAGGSPEAINGLVRVADDEQAPAAPAPGPHQLILGVVDVLKLVHQQVSKGLPTHGVQTHGLRQQIVEIQSAHSPQAGAVILIQRFIQVRAGAGRAVLHPGDRLQQLFGAAPDARVPQDVPGCLQGIALADEAHIPQ